MPRRYEPKNIDCKRVKPHATELVLRCGSYRSAGEYAGVDPNTLGNIARSVHCTVRMATAKKILDALVRKRVEDRLSGAVSNRLIEKIKKSAEQEKRIQAREGVTT